MTNILKVYIAHQGSFHKILHKLKEDTIIVVGGYETNTFENSILKIKCDDSYCGLPDKIVNLFKFVSESSELREYTHIYKLDEDMEFVKEIDFEVADYVGEIGYKEGINRNHHIGRCSGHYWDDKPFEGEIYDWCYGGSGYLISRKAFEIVAKVDGTKYALEDVMIGNVLGTNGIYPTLKDIKEYYRPCVNLPIKIKTYKDLKGRTWDQSGIPKWIFRAGNDSIENLHPEIAQIYNTQLENNPGYELFYFSREDKLQLIIDQNNDQLLYAYNTIVPEAFKTDIFRYVVITTYGGVYMDFSMQTLVPLADIIKDYTYVYVKDTAGDHDIVKGIYNAFIVSPKDNLFLNAAIEKCIYNIKHRIYGHTCLSITSPHLLGELYKELHQVDSVPVGEVGDDTVFYEHRLSNQFIESAPDVNLVQIKHPKHYEILYSTGDRYDAVWGQGRVFNSKEIKTYKDLKQLGPWEEDNIPRWIFRAGNSSVEDLPSEIIDLYTQQLEENPDYELFYFSEDDREQFFSDISDIHISTTYDKLIPPTYKVDFFKYVLMYNYGGVYFDFSMQSLIPLRTLIHTFKEVLAKDSGANEGLCAGFMASVKGTCLMEGAIERCIHNTRYNLICREPLDVTGPSMFGVIYKRSIGSEFITIGQVAPDVYIYEYKNYDYIYDGDTPIIKIRIPNHYSLLYKPGDDDLYYAKLWNEKRIYKTNDIKTFKDIKDRVWEGEGIPKWIFKTGPFKAEDLPDIMREIYLDILAKNPGYELFYFSNEDCMLSIHHHYGEEYFRLHQKLVPTAYQADFWRYLILNQYGGCYGDFTQVPLVSYDELTEGVDRVFVRDDPSNKAFLYNAVMCVKPNDPVVTKAINISIHNIKNNIYGETTLYVTGPAVLGEAFLKEGYNLNSRVKEISMGDYKGSRILQHRYSGGFVCDKDGKNVFMTKLANHVSFVYGNNHGNLHYDQAWREGRVYKY